MMRNNGSPVVIGILSAKINATEIRIGTQTWDNFRTGMDVSTTLPKGVRNSTAMMTCWWRIIKNTESLHISDLEPRRFLSAARIVSGVSALFGSTPFLNTFPRFLCMNAKIKGLR
jgi:hypothetical protein